MQGNFFINWEYHRLNGQTPAFSYTQPDLDPKYWSVWYEKNANNETSQHGPKILPGHEGNRPRLYSAAHRFSRLYMDRSWQQLLDVSHVHQQRHPIRIHMERFSLSMLTVPRVHDRLPLLIRATLFRFIKSSTPQLGCLPLKSSVQGGALCQNN